MDLLVVPNIALDGECLPSSRLHFQGCINNKKKEKYQIKVLVLQYKWFLQKSRERERKNNYNLDSYQEVLDEELLFWPQLQY
jgi:hypothetical protein